MMMSVVPVKDVHVTSISSDGDQSAVESGSDVYLQEGTSLGVGCVVATDGSRIPPSISVLVGDDDVTTAFNSSTEVDTDSSTGGLTLYRVVVRLTYVTSLPDRQLHGRRMVCTASSTGFDDVSATSSLLIRCKWTSKHTDTLEHRSEHCYVVYTPLITRSRNFCKNVAQVSTSDNS